MQFKVPQFIEHEAKIIGPLTFKQFIIVGSAGVVCLILFFVLEDNFLLWLMLSAIIVGFSLSLIFVQVEGLPLISLIGKSIGFFMTSRRYVWKKKSSITNEFIIQKRKKVLLQKETSPRIFKGSRIKKLWSEIEIK